MKIVFIAYIHGVGGAQKQSVLIANAMANLGCDVTLMILGAIKKEFEIDKRIKVINIEKKNSRVVGIIDEYFSIKKALKNIRPDVTISFWLQPIYLVAAMSKKIRGKIIYSERCDPSNSHYSGLRGLIRHFSFKKVDGFVFQTSAARSFFSKKIQSKSIIIPNPVFIDKTIRRSLRDDGDIVAVGRLHPQKNYKLLIKSFSLIEDKYPSVKLKIYGGGEQKKDLDDMIKKFGLSHQVLLMGESDNVINEIKDARLFVISSDYEGMPNALLEAMSIGLPCISTDWAPGGVSDIIKNGKNGIIVPAKNENELARAMDNLLSDDKKSKMIGEAAKESMEKHNPNKVFEKWYNWIKKVAGKNEEWA
ncbi:glycosyltransferase [Candidatus Saccharibacteria bacterium]|nr:glycosyltransferase [Candidatus Saccharibacteria bacterium]